MRLTIAVVVLSFAGFAFAEEPKPDDEAKVKRAKADIQTLTRACQVYKLKHAANPKSLEELARPPDGSKPILESNKILKDPWGKAYEYDPKGKRNDELKPDIWTVTPNKKEIGNWPEKK